MPEIKLRLSGKPLLGLLQYFQLLNTVSPMPVFYFLQSTATTQTDIRVI
jgi:hypothetical protein